MLGKTSSAQGYAAGCGRGRGNRQSSNPRLGLTTAVSVCWYR